jgi:hypothetical protein
MTLSFRTSSPSVSHCSACLISCSRCVPQGRNRLGADSRVAEIDEVVAEAKFSQVQPQQLVAATWHRALGESAK